MYCSGKLCLRRASLLIFGFVALAAFVAANDRSSEDTSLEPESSVPTHDTQSPRRSIKSDDFDPTLEANRAFKQAMHTLNNITQDQNQYTFDPSSAFSTHGTRSILSTLIPNPDSNGFVATTLRLFSRVRQNSFVRGFFSTLTNPTGNARQAKKEQEIRKKSVKVLDLLQLAAELGHQDALYALAQVSLFPPNDYFPSDPHLAYQSLMSHASTTGNASSQALIAFFHATGYHDVVPINQALAQLYYTFAANGGHKGAQMALGYRYNNGIGTIESCESALEWYQYASEQSMAHFLSGPPGGLTLPLSGTRLPDLVGGVYGYGSSVASTGMNALRPAVKAGLARAAGETWEDVLEYYMFNANRGEMDFAYRLGKIYYQGSIYPGPGGIASGGEGVGAVPQNFSKAMHYFLMIARKMWPKDPSDPLKDNPKETKDDQGPVRQAVFCAGYIGRMFLRGEGVKTNYALAKMWFSRGAEFGDRESQNGLGIMWRDGLIPGQKADTKEAKKYFLLAANDGLVEAHVNLGKYYYNRGELAQASALFDTAYRSGSPFEAYYYLGTIYESQVGSPSVSGSCSMAVSFHKHVAERGSWQDDLLKDGEVAWMSGTSNGKQVAILKWWIAAERGIEIAQTNLAYVLDQDRSILRLTRFSPNMPSNDTALLALTQWTRAAAQRNIDALVKVGDYYYHGLGVPPDAESDRYEKAAKYYQSAADTHLSALAMWNLGWMYENGIGVPQDFHLAKRNYDLALETNPEAYLPVLMSLLKLYTRSLWHTLQGGKDGLTMWDFEEPDVHVVVDELDNSVQEIEDTGLLDDGDDETWYIGKARDDLQRRTRVQPDNENDPVQWARERRLQDQEDDLGPEDYFEAATRGGNREQGYDDFAETMILVSLMLLISILIYIRTRLVDERRREEQQQNRAPERPPQPL